MSWIIHNSRSIWTASREAERTAYEVFGLNPIWNLNIIICYLLTVLFRFDQLIGKIWAFLVSQVQVWMMMVEWVTSHCKKKVTDHSDPYMLNKHVSTPILVEGTTNLEKFNLIIVIFWRLHFLNLYKIYYYLSAFFSKEKLYVTLLKLPITPNTYRKSQNHSENSFFWPSKVNWGRTSNARIL